MDRYRDSIRRLMMAVNKIDGLYHLAARRLGIKYNTPALLYALSDGGALFSAFELSTFELSAENPAESFTPILKGTPVLTVRPIAHDTKELPRIRQLYLEAFPRNERRPFEDLISGDDHIDALAFYDGELFCGFAFLLNSLDLSHILYFAIEKDLRGRGYGSAALTAIHELKKGFRVIADLERETDSAPNNLQRRKRKQFYLRNGYRETEVKYRWRHEDYEMLSHGGGLTDEEFDAFWKNAEKRG